MRKPILSVKAICTLSAVALIATLAIAGCAPSATSDNDTATTTDGAQTVASDVEATDPYVNDETCLSCHGGTYESIAKLTEQYGDWNPHASVHGAQNSCDNCHDRGQELSRNWCTNCHTYSAEGSSYYEEPLFL